MCRTGLPLPEYSDLKKTVWSLILAIAVCTAILISAMPEVDAAVTTIIMRFATLWFAVLLGVIVLSAFHRQTRQL